MKLNMTAILMADDIAAACAAYVSAETGKDVSIDNVTVPEGYTVTVTVGDAPSAAKPKAKPSAKKAEPKTQTPASEPEAEPEAQVEEEVVESLEPETTDEAPADEPEEAPAPAAKKNSIFNFAPKN